MCILIVKNFSKTREVFYQKKFDIPFFPNRIPLAFSFLEIHCFFRNNIIFLRSSAVEQSAVNRVVTGSNPVGGAILMSIFGEMAERLNATVLKTVVPQGTQGSNPCLSAIIASGGILKWKGARVVERAPLLRE